MSVDRIGQPIDRVLRCRQVRDRLGVGNSTIYDWMNERSPRYDRTFPKPFKLGASAVGWLESDISRWIEAKVAAARGGAQGDQDVEFKSQ